MNTIQPNTPAEQITIRRAVRLGTPVEMNALGNPPDEGWMEVDLKTGDQPDFNYLRYRIKEMQSSQPANRFSERELLAIMSAVIYAGQSAHPTSSMSYSAAVDDAKKLFHEIDSTPV